MKGFRALQGHARRHHERLVGWAMLTALHRLERCACSRELLHGLIEGQETRPMVKRTSAPGVLSQEQPDPVQRLHDTLAALEKIRRQDLRDVFGAERGDNIFVEIYAARWKLGLFLRNARPACAVS